MDQRQCVFAAVIAEQHSRRRVALVTDDKGIIRVDKYASADDGVEALAQEAEWIETARAAGVSVPEARLLSDPSGERRLRMRWMGDRTFERASLSEWFCLGEDLARLQMSLQGHPLLRQRPALSIPGDHDLANELASECVEILDDFDDRLYPAHGDFQIGNVIRMRPAKTAPSHVIIDFEGCCLDHVASDLASMIWSMWAYGETWDAIEAFSKSYLERTDRTIPSRYIGVCAVYQHLRWIDHLIRWDASVSALELALGALVDLRNAAPGWRFSV